MTNSHSELEFNDILLVPLLESLIDDDTLLVTDDYWYPSVQHFKNVVLVENNNFDQISVIKNKYNYSKTIAIGGCTSLDVGRAIAKDGNLIIIPTVLSNSCISVNRSILFHEGKILSEKTTTPDKTVISLATLMDNSPEVIKKWSGSGFADLFANISASIDYEYRNNNKSLNDVSINQIESNVPDVFNALNWVIDSYDTFDKEALKKLAHYLHNSSIDVIEKGDTRLSVADEHKMHYIMLRNEHYSRSIATHGRMVSVGTLISARIFGEFISDLTLYDMLREAYKKLGLPLNYKELEDAEMKKDHIIRSLDDLQEESDGLISKYVSENGYDILDKIFA